MIRMLDIKKFFEIILSLVIISIVFGGGLVNESFADHDEDKNDDNGKDKDDDNGKDKDDDNGKDKDDDNETKMMMTKMRRRRI